MLPPANSQNASKELHDRPASVLTHPVPVMGQLMDVGFLAVATCHIF